MAINKLKLSIVLGLWFGWSCAANAALVTNSTTAGVNIAGSSTTHTDQGLNWLTEGSGGLTSAGSSGSVTFQGWSFGGDQTQFGHTLDITGGVVHTTDITTRLTATNGTFDGNIGFEVPIGSAINTFQLHTDGVWTPGTAWTDLGGGVLQWNGGIINFVSGDPGGGFVPSVAGASYIESQWLDVIQFSGSTDYRLDLNLTSTVVGVPEPKVHVAIMLCCAVLLAQRRRRG